MKKILIAAVVTIAAVSAGVVARHKMRRQFTPYTLTQRVTDYDAQGNATLRYVETRAQSATGRVDDVKAKADGTTEAAFTEPGRGAFILRDGKLIQFDGAASGEAPNVTYEGLHRSTQFVHDEEVGGVPVCVMRAPASNGGADYMEVWRAPSLNGAPLRMVLVKENGTSRQQTTVWEFVALTHGEPDAAHRVQTRGDEPIDTGFLDKKNRGK